MRTNETMEVRFLANLCATGPLTLAELEQGLKMGLDAAVAAAQPARAAKTADLIFAADPRARAEFGDVGILAGYLRNEAIRAVVRCTARPLSTGEMMAWAPPRAASRKTELLRMRVPSFSMLASLNAAGERGWQMVANTGQVVRRAYGSAVFDLSGAQFSQRIPLLLDHDTQRPLGYSTQVARTSRGIEASGVFLANDDARRVQQECQAGFPYQASIYAEAIDLEDIPAGKSSVINGQTLAGPLHVFRTWKLRELTMCVLGADSDTSTELVEAAGSP